MQHCKLFMFLSCFLVCFLISVNGRILLRSDIDVLLAQIKKIKSLNQPDYTTVSYKFETEKKFEAKDSMKNFDIMRYMGHVGKK